MLAATTIKRLEQLLINRRRERRAVCGESRKHGSEGGTRVSSVATRRLEL